MTAFGAECGVEAVVVKSPVAERFVDVLQPGGSVGVVTESKRST